MSTNNLLKNFQSAFADIFSNFQRAATINHVTSVTYDAYDRPTQNMSSTSTYCVTEEFVGDVLNQDLGFLDQNVVVAYFNPGVTVSPKDTVTIDGATYECDSVNKMACQGTTICVWITLKQRA